MLSESEWQKWAPKRHTKHVLFNHIWGCLASSKVYDGLCACILATSANIFVHPQVYQTWHVLTWTRSKSLELRSQGGPVGQPGVGPSSKATRASFSWPPTDRSTLTRPCIDGSPQSSPSVPGLQKTPVVAAGWLRLCQLWLWWLSLVVAAYGDLERL